MNPHSNTTDKESSKSRRLGGFLIVALALLVLAWSVVRGNRQEAESDRNAARDRAEAFNEKVIAVDEENRAKEREANDRRILESARASFVDSLRREKLLGTFVRDVDLQQGAPEVLLLQVSDEWFSWSSGQQLEVSRRLLSTWKQISGGKGRMVSIYSGSLRELAHTGWSGEMTLDD